MRFKNLNEKRRAALPPPAAPGHWLIQAVKRTATKFAAAFRVRRSGAKVFHSIADATRYRDHEWNGDTWPSREWMNERR